MKIIINGEVVEVSGGSNGSSEEVYSTEETRIGTWIDGKPLYRRVVQGTIPSSFISGVLSNMVNVDTMTMARGFVKGGDGTTSFINSIGTQDNSKCFIYFDASKNLYIKTNIATFFSQPVTVVVEYTKTTDE